MASVASFFVSRIDTAVDAQLDGELEGQRPASSARLERLQGKIAIANAKLAYQRYQRLFAGAALGSAGGAGAHGRSACCGPAPAPRTRATATSLYVEELIGADTVEHDAAGDDGRVPRPRVCADSLEEDVDERSR